jgi:hypothetical protein
MFGEIGIAEGGIATGADEKLRLLQDEAARVERHTEIPTY